jgi:hypothetical protein
MVLGSPNRSAQYFEYFLNHANHKPGIPIDYIAYHFYPSPAKEQTLDSLQYTFFDQADGFLNSVRYVETIRKRLSPETKTDLDELGSGLPTDNTAGDSVPPPAIYWNLSGSLYAYLYIELSRLQIDIVGESQLVGYPTQFPTVSMMDWTNNQPNARFWVLKLIKDSFHPGDKLVETLWRERDIDAQAFVTPTGRKLLLVNKRNREIVVSLPDSAKVTALTVDQQTGDNLARAVQLTAGTIQLEPFAVTVATW